MAIQSAAGHFSREDIVDILQRNVQLYRDEVGFANYLVDLTMFLLDEHYGESRISPWEAPDPPSSSRQPLPLAGFSGRKDFEMPPTVSELQNRGLRAGQEASDRSHPSPYSAPPPSPMISARTPVPTSDHGSERNSSSSRIRISGIFPAASPTSGRGEVEVDPQSGRFRVSNDAVFPAGPNQPAVKDSSKFEVEASPLSTPPEKNRARKQIVSPDLNIPSPEADIDVPSSQPPRSGAVPHPYGEAEPPKINFREKDPKIGSSLRRSNFQIYRTAKSSTNVEVPCPSCGLKVDVGLKQCPGCGHFMSS